MQYKAKARQLRYAAARHLKDNVTKQRTCARAKEQLVELDNAKVVITR